MALIDRFLLFVVRSLLRLRYRIRVIGLDAVLARGKRGIVFFPNHPALIDPIIVMTTLFPHFRPKALADKDQIDRFFVRWMARRVGIVPLPDIRKHGPQAKAEVEARVHEVYESLQRDSNMLMYPSGHLYRTRYEDLRGNSGVETILREVPGVRVVLIRTRGLWGSRFGMASGQIPHVGKVLRQGLLEIVASFVFFTPRREVTLELHEPADLPRTADRNTLNEHLERFYNENAPPATLVPRTIWDRGGVREIPDPPVARAAGALSEIPASVRSVVTAQLEAMAEQGSLRDEQRLAQDLGLDSLDRAELALWLGREFGFHVTDVDAIQTVGDVMLAARGQAVVSKSVALKPVPEAWQVASDSGRVEPPVGATIAEAFLHAARRRPGAVAIADQIRGAMSYRDLVTAVMVLRPVFAKLPGERMGLMLPASVAACVAYLSIVFAGKTPVMVNWTAGARNILHGLDLAGVARIITSKVLVGRLRGQGVDVASFESRFVYLEDVGASLGRWDKLRAALLARVSWASLARVKASPHAAILFTSGSESLPKAVPLSHQNILSNLRDILRVIHVRRDDALIGFLPPFHSFGLTVTMLLPLVVRVRAAYHANPTEAWVIAQLIEAYRATVLLGTPTFLSGIARAAHGTQLASIRLAVTGAEKCPERTYQTLRERCPDAVVLEGYGITECSPIVSVNGHDARPGTIGRVLPSLEYALVDLDTQRAIERPARRGAESQAGMLLVRGPSVFGGYLGDAPTPFVEFAGRTWYRTGDLVTQDADGILTFRGRLKRFVKLGGEMISLPAIEGVFEAAYARAADEGPVVAIEASPSEESPEIVLFTTRAIDRAAANRLIREVGLSALHNVSRVRRLEAIPVLGTGKTDYRALREMLRGE